MNRRRRSALALSDGGRVVETWPEGWCRRPVPRGRSEYVLHWYLRGGRLSSCKARVRRDRYWARYEDPSIEEHGHRRCRLCWRGAPRGNTP